MLISNLIGKNVSVTLTTNEIVIGTLIEIDDKFLCVQKETLKHYININFLVKASELVEDNTVPFTITLD